MAAVLNENFQVQVYNHAKDLDISQKAKDAGVELVGWPEIYDCDIVIISTPISVTRALVKRVAPNLKRGALLLDVASVKEYPCQWLKKYAPKHVEIMGTHPMFGPTTAKFDPKKKYWEIRDKQIVLCPLRIEEDGQNRIIKFLRSDLGLNVIVTTPKDHDYQNAKTLSFVHFLGRSLTRAGITEQKIYTPGYADMLKILPHTNQDNWQLFYDMNNFNPYAKKIRKKFWRACWQIEEKIIRSDSQGELDFNRNMISEIDERIFELLETRMKHCRNIGRIKNEEGRAKVDPNREKELIQKQVRKTKLNPDFIKNVYKLLFRESYKKQK
ncbi:MAG TPA: prephenate dehydrogenase/arogenate dehydrogenase family protein, partial [Patescibacteria group bacterium]|nr:prephenate dehydrogenase/arogenate dehydrogenase family protein [Patescibacteria group bacterium]